MQHVEGLEAASPKKAMRLLRETGLLDEPETELALKMADDRNMTVHTYDEVFAQNLISRISAYELLMHDLFRRMLEQWPYKRGAGCITTADPFAAENYINQYYANPRKCARSA